jgi:hypothetical protein
MPPIPLYLKTDAAMPRPTDPEFYWLTQDGAFLCRNHPFFSSDVPTRRPIKALAVHEPGCVVRYPKVRTSTLEFIVGFFGRVFELHRSESVVLLLWDLDAQRYRIHVPEQEATVWESWSGQRSPSDVHYKLPRTLPPRHLLVGDIHCHGDMAAYASSTDRADERYRDGVHGVIGHIEREPPELHLELAIDGYRFALKPEQLFESYRKRRGFVPRAWLNQVKVRVESWGRSFVTRSYDEDYWTPRRSRKDY